MRILFRIIPLCMLLLGFVACDDEDEAKVETLEVTPANLNGTESPLQKVLIAI